MKNLAWLCAQSSNNGKDPWLTVEDYGGDIEPITGLRIDCRGPNGAGNSAEPDSAPNR